MKQRRNHSICALFVLVGAVLSLWAAFRPWVTVSSSISATLSGHFLEVAASPKFDSGGDDSTRLVLLCAAVWMIILALALLVVRVRVLGFFLRLGVLFGAAAPIGVAVLVWADISDPPSLLGLINVDPSSGLYVLSLGGLLCFVGVFVPANKYERLTRKTRKLRDQAQIAQWEQHARPQNIYPVPPQHHPEQTDWSQSRFYPPPGTAPEW